MTTNNQNILICSAGRRVSLVHFFQKEAKKYPKRKIKVFTTDLSPEFSSAAHVADGSFKVGKFTDTNYAEKLLELCIREKIKIVVPTIDSELQLLANNRELFLSKGINLIVSESALVNICRDKRKTNAFFESIDIKVPKVLEKNNLTFPCFIKPFDGSNSKDIYLIESEKMLSPYLLEREDLMFMEYLSKENFTEYTIDMYYNNENQLCCLVPRVRVEVRGGEVSKSITRKNELIVFLRERFNTLLGARGCITLQCFLSKHNIGEVYGIEINPRFGGGYPLSYWAGANYPSLILKEYLNDEKLKYFETWKENTMTLRYDEEHIVFDASY